MTEPAFEVAAGALLPRTRHDQAGVQVGHDLDEQPSGGARPG